MLVVLENFFCMSHYCLGRETIPFFILLNEFHLAYAEMFFLGFIREGFFFLCK